MNQIEKSTIIRTVILICALINQLLLSLGYKALPFDDDEIDNIVSTIITVVVALWSWWKNNSFTQNALKADKYLEECKNCNKKK